MVYAFEAVPAPKFDYGTLLSSMGVILCGLSILGIFIGHKLNERKAQDNCEEEAVANLDADCAIPERTERTLKSTFLEYVCPETG